MAFGQPTGPPATSKQVRELLELLNEAGHSDFRDARGPMGFTQRQAGGKFTRDEADGFIEQLHEEAEMHDAESATSPPETTSPSRSSPPRPTISRPKRAATRNDKLRSVPTDVLAAELQRRGWIVVEP